ncbi:MAG: hypothetical protein AAF224_03635 [Pseudomonadota bacterium]
MSIRKERETERGHLEFAQGKLQAKTIESDLTFDPDTFEAEIKRYLVLQNSFNELREKVRMEIRELQAKRTRLYQEKTLAASTLKELEADVAYLKKIDTSEIVCPTCNTTHETSFANTLRLSGDAETCRSYLTGTLEEIDKLTRKIETKTQTLQQHDREISEINAILGERRGKLTLREMLEHESRRIATVRLEDEKAQIDVKIGKIDEDVRAAEADMKQFSSQARKKEIIDFYQTKLRTFCADLNVQSPPDNMFEKLRPTVSDTGSELPRLLLAYQYAILHTVAQYSSAIIAPIVFDTAQHQDQDETNINAMIKFAFKKRPENTQFIFGTVSLHKFKHSGAYVLANVQGHLLKPEQYQEARSAIAPFVEQMFSDQIERS